jgi:hypothetical protein
MGYPKMADKTTSVDEWVARIQKTRSSKELLELLNKFRKLEWTDQERQKISHTYIKVVDIILKSPAESSQTQAEDTGGNDGPVWYEKM